MMSPEPRRLNLFEAFGVELEYMIVDAASLDVRPITDQLIRAECGRIESEIDLGQISWSNELALHVVELKTTAPESGLRGLAGLFHQHVQRINQHLSLIEPAAKLMPSAMHPWMNPDAEMKLWPHEYNEVYETYNRIFDCRGHGWANLQSVHLNLPFNGDEQFGRLHAAIRLLLPILPAIAASSPAMDNKLTGTLDNRLNVYQGNSARVPSLAGRIIPEPVFTEEDYRAQIFQRMYDDIAPLDPQGVLRDEFLNSRGAIARFGRGSIEIRVIDIQECPAADLAVLQAAVGVLKALCDERWSSSAQQRSIPVEPLYQILALAIQDADQARITNTEYLSLLGYPHNSATMQQIWQHLIQQTSPDLEADCSRALETILSKGPLARRILNAIPSADGSLSQRTNVRSAGSLWEQLCLCLQSGQPFDPPQLKSA
ncbi:MAG: glutamate-cysteine ligase family protein [Planctomycetaceae bacterium]